MVFQATFENERGVCHMLVFEQDVDVNVWVCGIHPVSDQKGAVLTIQDLQPNPGEMFPRGFDFHLKGFLTRRCGEAVEERIWSKHQMENSHLSMHKCQRRMGAFH